MQIVHSDSVFRVDPNSPPNYNSGNSLVKLMGVLESMRLAAEREFYQTESMEYLVPFEFLELYGPAGGDSGILEPERQDNKTDFQKQNVRDFHTGDTLLVRGWVTAGDWTGPFLRVSYRGGVDSRLSAAAAHQLGGNIKLWIRVRGSVTPALIRVPYNEETDRYEIEFWGYTGSDLRGRLDTRGAQSFDRGALMARADLVHGNPAEFSRDRVDGQYMVQVAPGSTMHPVLPLDVEIAWTDETERFWDSQQGNNYRYAFNMMLRGWDNFIGVGISPNPHGGVGFLEYRNLASNYGRYAGSADLGRQLEAWNFNAFGTKDHGNGAENFMAVDYMDLHILRPNCGIGLHRHRDNQEVFLMMEGRAFMVVGDWCKMPERERCFEIRTLRAGHLAKLRGGQLHGLMNPSDENVSLFMFGGYD